MSWDTVKLKPGVNVELTQTALEAGYSASDNIRFKAGLAQKMGGWAKYNAAALSGTPLHSHAWEDLSSNARLAVGTSTYLYDITGGTETNITPQTLVTNAAENFTTSAASPIVTVTDTQVNGITAYDSVFFNTPISVDGIILSGLYAVTAYISPTSYTITAATNGLAGVSNGGTVPSFTTTSSSPNVTVTFPKHGLVAGNDIVFPIATTVGGATIQGRYVVQSVTSADAFVIIASVAASSSAGPISMNSGNAQFSYYITIGPLTPGSVGSTTVYKTAGAGSWTVPAGVSSLILQGIAGGGNGYYAPGSGSGGGSGGAYAASTIAVSPGQILYYNVGAVASDTWARISVNSPPSSSTNGVLAKGGISATSTAGTSGGSAGSCVGSTVYSGGNGGAGGGTGGGGTGHFGPYTGSAAGSVTVPAGVTSATVESWGGGGSGAGTYGGGGGGAAYARSTITVTPGQQIYYSAGGTGVDSWVNASANSAPSSSSTGCLAKAGATSSSTSGGAGGQAASCIGSITYSGGTGGAGGGAGSAAGGGGGSAGSLGSGSNGVAHSGTSGGAGGAGNNGTIPGGTGGSGTGGGSDGGGGGGGANASGGTGGACGIGAGSGGGSVSYPSGIGAGGVGRVYITYTSAGTANGNGGGGGAAGPSGAGNAGGNYSGASNGAGGTGDAGAAPAGGSDTSLGGGYGAGGGGNGGGGNGGSYGAGGGGASSGSAGAATPGILAISYTSVSAGSQQVGAPITATDWTLDNWGELLVACPESGGVYYWGPSSGFLNASVIPSAPPFNTGAFVSIAEQQIIAYGSSVSANIGVYQDPMMVRWCDVENLTSWTSTVTNQAGAYRIPTGSRIVGGLAGPATTNYLWTDLNLWAMNYIGSQFVYGFVKVADNCGLAAKHAHAELSGSVYWRGASSFFVMTGGQVSPLPCTVWDAVFQDTDLDNIDKCFAGSNTAFSEVLFFFPSKSGGLGYCDKAAKFNAVENTWDIISVPRSTWLDVSVIPHPIATTNTGVIYAHESGQDADGLALDWWFETGFFCLSDGQDVASLDRIYPDAKWGEYGGSQNAQIQITISTAKYPGSPLVSYGPFTVTQATQFISKRMRGRYFKLRVEGNDLGSFARLGAIKFRWKPDGRGL